MSRLSNEEDKITAEENAATRAALEALLRQRDFLQFIRRFLLDQGALENSGMGPNVFGTNALTTAFESGRVAVLQSLVAYLTTVDPTYFIQILQEEQNAARRRSSRLAHLADAGWDDTPSE